MVTYTIEAIQVFLLRITPIPGRPNFNSLWRLTQDLYNALQKIEHPHYRDEGFAGYIMPKAAFGLYSSQPWMEPPDQGEYFEIPAVAITETEQKTGERR